MSALIDTLSALGVFFGGTAAWAAFLSPRAKAARQARVDASQQSGGALNTSVTSENASRMAVYQLSV